MRCRCFLAGAVPDLASGAVGSAHHLWVGRVVWGWLLWVSWQSGLLYDDNQTKVGPLAVAPTEGTLLAGLGLKKYMRMLWGNNETFQGCDGRHWCEAVACCTACYQCL